MAVQTVGADLTVHTIAVGTSTQTVGKDLTVHVTSPTAQQVQTVGSDFTVHVLSSSSVTIANQAVEPSTAVTVAALTSGTATSYTWAQTAGTAVVLTPAGSSCSFQAPGALTQATVTLQVTAAFADGSTGVGTCVVTVLPSTEFYRTGTGTSFVDIFIASSTPTGYGVAYGTSYGS